MLVHYGVLSPLFGTRRLLIVRQPARYQALWIRVIVIVIGAGAAGMMCAAVAGARGRRVLLVEHSEQLGEKMRISGGGRCSFTNIHTRPEAFLPRNRD